MKKFNSDTKKYYKVFDQIVRTIESLEKNNDSHGTIQDLERCDAKLYTIKERKLPEQLRASLPLVKQAIRSFIRYLQSDEGIYAELYLYQMQQASRSLEVRTGG